MEATPVRAGVSLVRKGEPMSAIGVRSFQPGDRPAVRDISYATGFMGESAERFWRHRDSWADVWTSYYTDGEPESLHVATMDGAVVGYLAGCIDTAAMHPTTDELIVAAIRRHWLLIRPGTARFLYRAMFDGWRDTSGYRGEFVDPRWPAHLHIDLLPAARGIGLGTALMERWLGQLALIQSPGCHLSTLIENERARSFFEKAGFRNHDEPTLVPGMRGVLGERLHQQIMVWNP
jgi:ribosomal protein S18 acetylase RimI-like enzyme